MGSRFEVLKRLETQRRSFMGLKGASLELSGKNKEEKMSKSST